jgi:hypothetical protein
LSAVAFGADLTGEYSIPGKNGDAVVSVLQGERELFIRVVTTDSDRSCVCSGLGAEPGSGKGYSFGPKADFTDVREQGDGLLLAAKKASCCARQFQGGLRLESAQRQNVRSCSISARRAYFHGMLDRKRRGSYLVSGDKIDAVVVDDEWIAARFDAKRRSLGLVRGVDVDCHGLPTVKSVATGIVSYRMLGSVQDQEGDVHALKCDGSASVLVGSDPARPGDDARCYFWRPESLSCDGSQLADHLAWDPESPRVCMRGGKWKLADTDCAVDRIEEQEGVLRALKVTCVWQCVGSSSCDGRAEYELGGPRKK